MKLSASALTASLLGTVVTIRLVIPMMLQWERPPMDSQQLGFRGLGVFFLEVLFFVVLAAPTAGSRGRILELVLGARGAGTGEQERRAGEACEGRDA